MTIPTPPAEPTEPVEPPAEPDVPAAEPPAPAPAPETIDSLPDWAQREIRTARKQAGDYRAGKKTAEQELAALRDEFAVKLGLKPAADAPDPALSAAQQAAKDAAVELAVFRAASTDGVNADRLLDSASFLANVRSLDHASSTFKTDLTDAIAAAVQADPSLKTARAAGASTPDLPGTPGEQGRITEAELAATAKTNPELVAQWLADGKLTHLL